MEEGEDIKSACLLRNLICLISAGEMLLSPFIQLLLRTPRWTPDLDDLPRASEFSRPDIHSQPFIEVSFIFLIFIFISA